MKQGSDEWLAFRKTKITATDASIIMGASHWKTKIQLFYEKKSNDKPAPPTEKMQRGIDLEPVARELFILKTGIFVEPAVAVRDWSMASLDGMSADGNIILEIKCPGEKDHAIALQEKVPDHYYPQIQHQIYVMGLDRAYYFSFDGFDGHSLAIERDNEYIEKMLIEEKKFYDCLINNTPPEPSEGDYIERNDSLWEQCASRWRSVNESIKKLEREEEELRKNLISLSGELNSKGAGISLCQIQRKGNVDYTRIPELKNIDLEKYRKPTITSWRISA